MDKLTQATFARVCFWFIETAFSFLTGVDKVRSGFTGGRIRNLSYEQLHRQDTGHCEAVRVWYDPKKMWKNDTLKLENEPK